MIGHIEQGRKQFSDSGKAGSCIGNEKDYNHKGGNQGKNITRITETVREKLRNCIRIICHNRISSEALCYDQPVDICTYREADCCPDRFREAGQVSQSGQPHQKPAAHVGSFSAHRGHKGAEMASAQIKISDRLILLC